MLNEDHASKIARDWNVKHSGSGYVTRFRVRRSFLDRYQIHQTRAAAALADSARRGAGHQHQRAATADAKSGVTPRWPVKSDHRKGPTGRVQPCPIGW